MAMDDPRPDTSRYVAFEGAEGAGKSSVARRVATHLGDLGLDVVLVREPGGTHVGEAIREILLAGDHHPLPRSEAALFAAARAQLVAELVVPALRRGAFVLSDRSAYSSLAYQAGGRGIPMDEVRRLNDIAIGGVWPGTVILLRIDPETGLRRQAVGDRIGNETSDFHADVERAFDALAAREPERFRVVDASRPIGAVVEDVLGLIRSLPGAT
jgi:dTMP kinase